MDEASDPVPARIGPWRREGRAFLELFALTGVAVAQPTLEILKKNTDIFVTRDTSRVEVMALAAILVLAPALALWLVEVGIGAARPRWRRGVHGMLAALVIAAIAIEGLKKQTELGPGLLVALAIPAAVLGGWLLLRFAFVSLWLRYLAVAPVIFAVLFVFFSPVTTAVFGEDPGAAEVSVGRPNRVVMIVLDEFPVESLLDGKGRIDAALFPNFAALAQQSTWYRNTTTVAAYTTDAVPAILTGDYPEETTIAAVAADRPDNLFTLLGGTYEMNAHESFTRLCPATLCGGGPSAAAGARTGFSGLLADSYDLWHDFASAERQPTTIKLGGNDIVGDNHPLRTGRRFADSLTPARRPRLDFLHVLLPHEAWHYLPSGQDYEQLGETAGQIYYVWRTEWTARLARQRHLLQVGATDRLLGEVVAKLKRIGAYDDTLLVVTADHGIAFTAGQPLRGVSEQNAAQILWPPLFVKAPGETRGVVDDRPARTIDILPTIADHLDVELPWKIDGRSLLAPPVPEGPARVFDWEYNTVEPPPGEKYATVPGPANFADAMLGQASGASGPADLRLFKIGEYGELLGRPVGPLVRAAARPATATIEDTEQFRSVDPTAKRVPWVYVSGSLRRTGPHAPLAIALNGTVAGFSASVPAIGAPERLSFWATLPPQLFRPGRNDVALYVIRGSADAPTLEPVRLPG